MRRQNGRFIEIIERFHEDFPCSIRSNIDESPPGQE